MIVFVSILRQSEEYNNNSALYDTFFQGRVQT